ncbi:MAG: TolC family protein, partial [Acidobacteriota bacterium]|nr:TolC family protein [Acidobacteriota bacterium]
MTFLLLMLGSLCAQPPTPGVSLADAIESTLRDNPQLRIQQQQVEFSRGSLLRAQSQFDRVIGAGGSSGRVYQPLDEIQRTVYGVSSATTNSTSADAEASQQFRTGITVTPMLTVTRLTDNVASPNGLNQGHLGIQVNLPLLRGRGRSIVGAAETAGGIEVEASLLDLNQTISNLVYSTAVAYWTAVAAGRTLDVANDAEARGRVLLETVEALVAADRDPRSDLSDVQANLADRTATRIGAEQQLLQAKQDLAIAMGLSADRVAGVGNPTDALPAAQSETAPRDPQAAISTALTRRADYLAAKKRQGEADVLAFAARNQLKPQLDLQLNSGFSGLREGRRVDEFAVSPFSGVHGLDATVGLRYQFPLENRAAEANVV